MYQCLPAKEDNSMDNGFTAYIQMFIDFILKIIALFKSNENTESNKKKWNKSPIFSETYFFGLEAFADLTIKFSLRPTDFDGFQQKWVFLRFTLYFF